MINTWYLVIIIDVGDETRKWGHVGTNKWECSHKNPHICSNSLGCSELWVPAGGNRCPDKGQEQLSFRDEWKWSGTETQAWDCLLGYSAQEDKSSERNDAHIPIDHKFMGNVSELQFLLILYLQAEALRKSFVYNNRA